ncbi:hypothetical protein [Gordonia aquimaris]|uniref:Uncharacterized protein n=1 Tax=Gordonia aquimaris TaxID=2984863 RepID=A0A9X3D1P9_9ACTN|nr:hypothetical protein [Gordonia aquimaris]MCX2963145.1 hypothetical protein [Gordonia aquimaris]
MTIAMPPALLAGEVVRYHGQFTPRTFVTHAKTTVTVTDRRVIVHDPHLLFGIFRHGFIQHEAPLRHVSRLSLGTKASGRRMFYGAVSIVLALTFFATAASLGVSSGLGLLLGLVFLGIAVFMFITANTTGIFFDTTGGGVLVAAGNKSELPEMHRAGFEIGQLLFS